MNITPLKQDYYAPTFAAYQKTFVMIKPDAFERKLDNEIMSKINDSGMKVLQNWNGIPSKEKMEGNYIQYKQKSFFDAWLKYLTSGNIRAMVIGGEESISVINSLKKIIRQQYAPGEKRFNLIHSSDDVASAKREIENFFDIEV